MNTPFLPSPRILVAALVAAGAFTSALAADIKLGAAEALSGAAGQYGQSIKNGLQLAVDEINAAGGVKGNKIALQIEDEQTKKEQAIDVFKKLIFQDKVLMLFGPTLSSSAQAADPVAQAAKIVVFGTSNTADGITSIGDYVFRNSVTEADVLPETLRVAAKHANVKKVAILYGNDDIFTKSGYDAFKKALDDLKIPVTATETFAKGDVDFKAQLTKIKASNPDAIVLSALIAEGAPIMVQARQLGIDAALHRRQRHELGQDLRPGQGKERQPLGRQPVGDRQPDQGEPALRGLVHAEVQVGARPVRGAGLRCRVRDGAGARQDQAHRQRRGRPQGAARRAAHRHLDRRDRRVHVQAGDGQGRQAGRLRRASRPRSSA